MKALAVASARYLLAAVSFGAVSIAAVTGIYAKANRDMSDLYIRMVDELTIVDKMVLQYQAKYLEAAMGYFWPAAILIVAAFVAVYLLGRRHHPLWFTALGLMVVANTVLEPQFRLVIWMTDRSGEGIYEGLVPGKAAGSATDVLYSSVLDKAAGITELGRELFGSGISEISWLITALAVLLPTAFYLALGVVIAWPVAETWKRFRRHPELPVAPAE